MQLDGMPTLMKVPQHNIVTFGSEDVQSGNTYSHRSGGEIRYGPLDIHTGNTYPENPHGTNVYAPILIQKNNTYQGGNDKVAYGVTFRRYNNVYPKNSGIDDIYDPVVVQSNNIYPKDMKFPDISKRINEMVQRTQKLQGTLEEILPNSKLNLPINASSGSSSVASHGFVAYVKSGWKSIKSWVVGIFSD